MVTESKAAFVFPGQGSQSIGMLADLDQAYPVVRDTFAEASTVLGYDLWSLIQEGPIERLNQTEFTQPALLAAGVAVWRCWQARSSLRPDAMAGHSLGEYTALVCAEAIDFSDAVRLVAARARIMANAVPNGTGAMVAILGLEDKILESLCDEGAQGAIVQCSNYNAPGQVVIGGERSAVSRVTELAKANGARKVIDVPMSVPSHCYLMKPAADALTKVLDDIPISPPKIPVVHNYDILAHRDAALIRQALYMQLFNPVRWVELVRRLRRDGAQFLIECGPGKVLTGLGKRIDKDLACLSIFDAHSLDVAIAELCDGS